MEVASLQREVTKLKTEKVALTVKSKLFENFAAMAHSCRRLPSATEWEAVMDTSQRTLQFSTELTGAVEGNLVLVDSHGVVTDRNQWFCDKDQDKSYELSSHDIDERLSVGVKDHRQVGLINDTLDDDRWSLTATGPAVGTTQDMQFDMEQVQIESGEILFGYTDGVVETIGSNGDSFTRERLLNILEESPSSAEGLVESIRAHLLKHIQNAPPSDDITMLAVQRLSVN
jgi:hypothetical protein